MDRIFDQEMKFSIKPNENNKQFFMQNNESIKNKIIKLLKDEFKDDIKISSQMKFGIDYFTEKFLNNENFTFVKYGDGELLCMLGAKGENCDFHPYTPKLLRLLFSFAPVPSVSKYASGNKNSSDNTLNPLFVIV